MHSGAVIELELCVDGNENSINGLLWMVFRHGYDHMPIARLVPHFVLQPWYDETIMDLSYQYVVDGEFKHQNHHFVKYDVGLAGDGAHVSSPSCFFITVGDDLKRLDGHFTYVGRVVSGYEEIERIMHVSMHEVCSGVEGVSIFQLDEDEIIDTITWDLNDYHYHEPKQYIEKNES